MPPIGQWPMAGLHLRQPILGLNVTVPHHDICTNQLQNLAKKPSTQLTGQYVCRLCMFFCGLCSCSTRRERKNYFPNSPFFPKMVSKSQGNFLQNIQFFPPQKKSYSSVFLKNGLKDVIRKDQPLDANLNKNILQNFVKIAEMTIIKISKIFKSAFKASLSLLFWPHDSLLVGENSTTNFNEL